MQTPVSCGGLGPHRCLLFLSCLSLRGRQWLSWLTACSRSALPRTSGHSRRMDHLTAIVEMRESHPPFRLTGNLLPFFICRAPDLMALCLASVYRGTEWRPQSSSLGGHLPVGKGASTTPKVVPSASQIVGAVPGFATVPPKLIQKIISGEYDDMGELLPETWRY